MTDDGYDCFRELAEALPRLGLPSYGEALVDAIGSGSTASECLGCAGQVIAKVRNQPMVDSDPQVRRLIMQCVSAVRLAWPEFK